MSFDRKDALSLTAAVVARCCGGGMRRMVVWLGRCCCTFPTRDVMRIGFRLGQNGFLFLTTEEYATASCAS